MALTTTDHRRDVLGLTYVYPVISRRAGGVSVGINLNPNNACNFRCIYCQVPNLVRGRGPIIDLVLLRNELDQVLGDIVSGDFMASQVPEGARRLNDIALSGNGEPTSSPQFEEAVAVVAEARTRYALDIQVVLITNGSMVHKASVQRGLEQMRSLRGEVWFKLDRATPEGMKAVNGLAIAPEEHVRRLAATAGLCPTWVQTAAFTIDGEPPPEPETTAYLAAIRKLIDERVPLQGVLLYGLARPSLQAEAERLASMDSHDLDTLAERIRALGLPVRVSR